MNKKTLTYFGHAVAVAVEAHSPTPDRLLGHRVTAAATRMPGEIIGTHVKLSRQSHRRLGGVACRLFRVWMSRGLAIDGSGINRRGRRQRFLLVDGLGVGKRVENARVVAQKRQVATPPRSTQEFLHLADGRVALLVGERVLEIQLPVRVGIEEVGARVVAHVKPIGDDTEIP